MRRLASMLRSLADMLDPAPSVPDVPPVTTREYRVIPIEMSIIIPPGSKPQSVDMARRRLRSDLTFEVDKYVYQETHVTPHGALLKARIFVARYVH